MSRFFIIQFPIFCDMLFFVETPPKGGRNCVVTARRMQLKLTGSMKDAGAKKEKFYNVKEKSSSCFVTEHLPRRNSTLRNGM